MKPRNDDEIEPGAHPRAGWEEAGQAMAECGDDQLIDGPLPPQTSFDAEEWEW